MPNVENEPVQKEYTPNPRNNPAIFKIFDNVQYNAVQHKKYAKEMLKLFKKVNIVSLYFCIVLRNSLYLI